MSLKLRKTGQTGGRSSAGKSFRPRTSAEPLWKAIRLKPLGIFSSSKAFRSFFASGQAGL